MGPCGKRKRQAQRVHKDIGTGVWNGQDYVSGAEAKDGQQCLRKPWPSMSLRSPSSFLAGSETAHIQALPVSSCQSKVGVDSQA